MGGFGSGRYGGKRCTEDLPALDVRRIQRAGLLTPGQSYNWQWSRNTEVIATIGIQAKSDSVVLDYRSRSPARSSGEWETMTYPVRLDWTPCYLGGERVWWRCPAAGCGRRVAVLFGGRIFACRHCHHLAYLCQRETDDDRAARRAETLRRRLGWQPGILNGEGERPKGMHRSTFDRLQRDHNAFVDVALARVAARLGLRLKRHPWGIE